MLMFWGINNNNNNNNNNNKFFVQKIFDRRFMQNYTPQPRWVFQLNNCKNTSKNDEQ